MMRNILITLLVCTSLHGLDRSYNQSPSVNDRNDIRYIVNTLSNEGLAQVLFKKGSLEKAGDRIEHVHPLQFLLVVFSSEEMKAGIHNIHAKPVIWKDFFGGLRNSLEGESRQDNVDQYIDDFAVKLNISPSLIDAAVTERRWKDFVDILLTHIPRSSKKNRYDD